MSSSYLSRGADSAVEPGQSHAGMQAGESGLGILRFQLPPISAIENPGLEVGAATAHYSGVPQARVLGRLRRLRTSESKYGSAVY